MSNFTELSTEDAKSAYRSLEEFTDILMDRAWRYLEAKNPNGRLSTIPGPNVIYSHLYKVTVKNLKDVIFEDAEYVEFEVDTIHSPGVPRVYFKVKRSFALATDLRVFFQSGCSMD